MLFCEKCNLLVDNTFCPNCRNKKLREVSDEDFCYFVDLRFTYYEMFEQILKKNDIDVVSVPYYPGNMVVFSNAGRADGRKVYIRYKDFDLALKMYNSIFSVL